MLPPWNNTVGPKTNNMMGNIWNKNKKGEEFLFVICRIEKCDGDMQSENLQ